MPGRPMKPTHLKIIQGTLRKSRIKNEPQPNALLGDPPAHLTPEQGNAWHEIVRLCPAGVLTNADRVTVEILACLLVEARTNPLFSVRRLALLLTLLGKCGLTPADRAKIDLPESTKRNPFTDL